MPHRYISKPVEIEAAHFKDQLKTQEIADWCGGSIETRQGLNGLHNVIMIETLEGVMRADPNDYVIKGIQGEFYPCKPDIFEAKYARSD